MRKILIILLLNIIGISGYTQTIEYKSKYATISESTQSQLTFNYKDSLIILKTADKKRVYWMQRYYEGVKEYIDATDSNNNEYTFSF